MYIFHGFVPTPRSTWPQRTLRVLIPIAGILLVIQYVAGLLTNAYGPSAGFTDNTSFPALNLHYLNGDFLGVVAIIVVVVAAFTRQVRFIALSVVMLAAILVAGIAGMAFVSSTPNNPVDTVLMGVAFLVAFWAQLLLAFFAIMRGRGESDAPPASAMSS